MQKGYPSDWSSRSKEVKQRDNYTCQNCGARGGPYGDAELHAHHSVPISKGGTHRKSNLITHCKECHKAIHGKRPVGRTETSTSQTSVRKLSIDNESPVTEKETIKTNFQTIGSLSIIATIATILLSGGLVQPLIIGTIVLALAAILFSPEIVENYRALKTINSVGRWQYAMDLMKSGDRCLNNKSWLGARRDFRKAAESFAIIYEESKGESYLDSNKAEKLYYVAKRRMHMCTDLENENMARAEAEQKRANELAKKIQESFDDTSRIN